MVLILTRPGPVRKILAGSPGRQATRAGRLSGIASGRGFRPARRRIRRTPSGPRPQPRLVTFIGVGTQP
jgi:hypothetical protein